MNTLKSYLMTPREEIERDLREIRILRKRRAQLLFSSALLMLLAWLILLLKSV